MAERLPLLIGPTQLNTARERTDVQIVAVADARTHTQVRIPGAIHMTPAAFIAEQPPVAGLLPDTQTLARALTAAGLRDDAHIVVYDPGALTLAARLVYTLHAMGHDTVSLLDGGLPAWHADGFELASGDYPAAPAGHFQVTARCERIADHAWIHAHLDATDTRFIDVRSAAEYSGADPHSTRGGHIPGAIHIELGTLLQADGRMRDAAELRALLAAHNIRPEHDAVVYCQSHMRSSLAYVVLRALGYTHVRGYPGAWSDWGNRGDTPISTTAGGAA